MKAVHAVVTMLAVIGALSMLNESIKSVLPYTRELESSVLVPLLKPSTANCSATATKAVVLTSDDFIRIQDGDENMRFDNPKVLEYARRRLLAPSTLALSPTVKQFDYSQLGQSAFIDKLLNGKTKGFHVECGAANGEVMSNSLFFELHRDWTGLLVEPNPPFYEALLKRNRQAYAINACLSPSNQTKAFKFISAGFIGGLTENMDRFHKKILKREEKREEILIPCFPIHSLLMSLGRTHIDYFSLDVEGAEIDILHTIPWGAVTINAFTIEYRVWNGDQVEVKASQKKLENIRKIFAKTGLYEEVSLLPPYNSSNPHIKKDEYVALDVVFMRKDLIE